MTENAIREAVDSTYDPVKKLELLMETTLSQFIHDGGEFAAIMMDFWAEGVRHKDEEVLEIINLNLIYKKYREIIVEILNEGISSGVFKEMDVTSMACALIGAFDGLLLQWIMDREHIDMLKISKVMLNVFLHGFKK
jgi:hypothetical protein